MADLVFNIAKGAAVEKFRDSAAKGIFILLTTTQADGTVKDHDNISVLLAAANTEANATNYARKTDLTATITVDDTNDRVDLDIPDQTWSSLGNGANNTTTDLIIAYEESAADTGRIPLTLHDFVITTDGNDVIAQVNSAGFYRAA